MRIITIIKTAITIHTGAMFGFTRNRSRVRGSGCRAVIIPGKFTTEVKTTAIGTIAIVAMTGTTDD